MKRWLIAAIVLLLGRGRQTEPSVTGTQSPVPRADRAARRAENLVLALLLGAGACATGFVAAYVLEPSTQLLGLAIGTALACLGAASVVASKRLVPREQLEEPLGERERPVEAAEAAHLVREGITRRRLLLVAAGGAVGAVGAALVTPAASLGPLLDEELLLDSPWLPGRLLVDEHGSPVRIDELEIGSFVTAFAQDADRRRLDASLVVVRLRPDEVRLPAERADWAPDGVLAFSKVCTHAGCAISLFRYPTFEPTSKQPALVCPCHYSAFDPRTGGEVLYGPAVRALPQLPLIARADGALAARAGLSGPVGPSWWKVRR